MKIQKILSLFLSTLLLSSSALGGTYNFYFYDNEDGKNKQDSEQNKKESQELEQKSEDKVQSSPSTPTTPTQAQTSSVGDLARPAIKSFFEKFRDNYLAAGAGMESYLANKYAYTLRVKFLPFLGFEGAIPTNVVKDIRITQYSVSKYQGRATAFLEHKITQSLAVTLNGGMLFSDGKVPDANSRTRFRHSYVGIGTRWVLLGGLMNITASANTLVENFEKISPPYRYPLESFYTTGVTLNIL